MVKVGDLVRFWRGTEYPDFIYIFREGLPLYGMGRLGMVPDSHFSVMCPYVENNGSFIASVYEKNENSCSIEVREKTADELEQEEKERLDGLKNLRDTLHARLTKKYRPRKPVEIALEVKRGIKLISNERIYLKFEDIGTYLNQGTLRIEFTNQDGQTLGYLSDYSSALRILNAHFNGCRFDIENLYSGDGPARLLLKPRRE